ncbi:MAG: hypothetical protein KF774_00010 [Planctomyces sp.]|nr:hypothetical protein [Planctomyces sp.]
MRRSRRNGYTLAEFLAVLVLSALMILPVLPEFAEHETDGDFDAPPVLLAEDASIWRWSAPL